MTDTRAIEACERLLRADGAVPEDNIRQNLGRLLDALEIDNLITYATEDGPADLYLPRRRTFIEAKKVGLADDPDAVDGDESPRQQLERYLKSEMSFELGQLAFHAGEAERTRPWTGIVTDGRVWHAWRYPHEEGALGQTIFKGFRPTSAAELLGRVRPIVGADPIGKPWIPANPSSLFEGYIGRLRTMHTRLAGNARTIAHTQMELWLDMLKTSSMAPEDPYARTELFLAHTFLVTLARGVIHTLARPDHDPQEDAILREGFVSWTVGTSRGRTWARDLFASVHAYEWRSRRGDVLKPVYETFVDARDRKVFGEYYTPDWLAEMLVDEVLDAPWCERAVEAVLVAERRGTPLSGIGVLDPSCGSGTFLYHAARRLLRTPALRGTAMPAPVKAAAVVRLLNGIDVHPIAAEISRATIMRALPAEPPAGIESLRVFQGDSLLAEPRDALTLFTHTCEQFRFESPSGVELALPRAFASAPTFSTDMRRLTESAMSNAGKPEEAPDYRHLPADILATVEGADRDLLVEFHRILSEVIDDEGNGVWAWYMVNITGPVRLAERKVDRIVANPPWVRMADIQVDRRKETLIELAREQQIDLWIGGRQAPHFDIAQLFVKRTRQLYMADPNSDPAAWIVKKAALRAGNWERFRTMWWPRVGAQTLDLDALKPFGGGDARRCCVLMEMRGCRRATDLTGDRLVVDLEDSGTGRRVPAADAQLSQVVRQLRFRRAAASPPERASWYDGKFYQGATVTPKVLAFVAREDASPTPGHMRVATMRSNKKPWVEIEAQRGDVPDAWLCTMCEPGDVSPFLARPATRAIIPVGADGALIDDPGSQCAFWRELDDLYREHRGIGGNTPRTLLGRFDYASQLSRQLPAPEDWRGRCILYPRSGDIMRGARLVGAAPVMGSGLYWWVAASEDEAAYLAALLNADSLAEAFRESRSSGRDFHLYPWRRIPIPRFRAGTASHMELAGLCREAETAVADWIDAGGAAAGQVARSGRIRALLRDNGIMERIDGIVRRLLPGHSA